MKSVKPEAAQNEDAVRASIDATSRVVNPGVLSVSSESIRKRAAWLRPHHLNRLDLIAGRSGKLKYGRPPEESK